MDSAVNEPFAGGSGTENTRLSACCTRLLHVLSWVSAVFTRNLNGFGRLGYVFVRSLHFFVLCNCVYNTVHRRPGMKDMFVVDYSRHHWVGWSKGRGTF